MTGDELVRILAWPALGLWLIALVLFVRRRDRSVAIIQGVLTLPFVIGAAMALTKWGIDPAEYTRQYGTAALRELPTDAVILGIALFILVSCGLAVRGRRLWLIPPLLLNGVGVVVLFYFAYFFRIF
jgi:hypothetical protein